MKFLFSVLFSALLICNYTYAQFFNNSYTCNENTYSKQSSLVIDLDGSSVTAHTIREYPNSPVYDVRVLKVDDNGNILWSKQFGVPGEDDRVNGIVQTDDEGYLILGSRDDVNYGYGSWIFKLDNGGNLIWSRWYGVPNANHYSEAKVGVRSMEDEETYIIAGNTHLPKRIYAMQINQNGDLYWSYQYYRPALVNSKYDYVNSIVADKVGSKYIIAGTEHDYYTTGFSTLDLFTLGIRQDGNLVTRYNKYDLSLGDNENEPHITQAMDQGQFILGFGTRAGNVQANTVSFISTMLIDNALSPIKADMYASPNGLEHHAHSIHFDPHGFYDLGCFIYEDYISQPGGERNASLLRIDPNYNPMYYYRYNVGQDQVSTFMAQDFTAFHENYVLKTDHLANGIWSIGLIRTELDGTTDCFQDEPINHYFPDVNHWQQGYRKFAINEVFETHIEEWNTDPQIIHCADLMFSGNEKLPSASSFVDNTIIEQQQTLSTDSEVEVYPTLINDKNETITLDYQAVQGHEVTIMVYDVQGRLVYQAEEGVTEGINRFFIETSRLSQGMNTILILENEKIVHTSRVIKI